jgi:hypothetical protein
VIPIRQPGPTFLQVSGQYITLIQSSLLLTHGTKIKNKNKEERAFFCVGGVGFSHSFRKALDRKKSI